MKMSVEVTISGPAIRAETTETRNREHYFQRERVETTAIYTASRRFIEPNPDIDAWIQQSAWDLALSFTELTQDPATAGDDPTWTPVNSDDWEVRLTGGITGWVECAEAAGRERHRDPADILRSWEDHPRTDSSELRAAFESFTGRPLDPTAAKTEVRE